MNRRVTSTGKNEFGDITSLCGAGWGRSKAGAIMDIESGAHSYYVQDSMLRRADVHVGKNMTRGKCLRTDPNSSCSTILESLPDC